jgi:hypothetical protein
VKRCFIYSLRIDEQSIVVYETSGNEKNYCY